MRKLVAWCRRVAGPVHGFDATVFTVLPSQSGESRFYHDPLDHEGYIANTYP
jgi:hypothetical protein